MLFVVDSTAYAHCAQIQIKKIAKTSRVKIDLERVLQAYHAKFGRIVKITMLNDTGKQERNAPTTMALLQYEKSASHMKAISYFTDENPITFSGRVLKFVPAGFTNVELCPSWIDYSNQRYRLHMGNIPIFQEPHIPGNRRVQEESDDNVPITSQPTNRVNRSLQHNDSIYRNNRIKGNYTSSVSQINNNAVVNNKQTISRVDVIPADLSTNVANAIRNKNDTLVSCTVCYHEFKWITFLDHRCGSACAERKEVLEAVKQIDEKLKAGQRDNYLVKVMRDICWVCKLHLHTFDYTEIRTLNCGHDVHKSCYNRTAMQSGIPMAKTQLEVRQVSQTLVSCKNVIVENDLEILSHRLIVCAVCNRTNQTQMQDFNKTIYKEELEPLDLVIDEDNVINNEDEDIVTQLME